MKRKNRALLCQRYDEDEKAKEWRFVNTKPKISTHILLIASILCLTAGNIFYQNSLATGDIEWVHHNIDFLAHSLVWAVLFYLLGLSLLLFVRQRIPKFLWTSFAGIVALIEGFLLTLDMGASLEGHGLFNLVMLVVLIVPVLLYALTWVLAVRFLGTMRGVALHICFLTAILVTLNVQKHEALKTWPVGLFGRKLEFESHGVKLSNSFMPWQAVQPQGWNSILGQSCPDNANIASLSGGILTINCDTSLEPYYRENPDFISGRDDDTSKLQDIVSWNERMGSKVLNYSQPVKTNAESIQVVCGDAEQILLQATENKPIVERIVPAQKAPPNIIVLFIDTLSRAHFFRRLSKTVKAMEDIHNTGAGTVYQFFKYHAMGPHTGPNTVPMFTGGDEEEFDLEQHPYWWKTYDESKYVRSWLSGYCESWAMQYQKQPFPSNAFDHMLTMPFCHPDAYPLKNPHGPLNGPFSARRRCIGNKKVHQYILQYARDYIKTYPIAGKLLTLSFMEGHEGTGEVISQLDDDLADFLQNGLGEKANNSFIFVVSDHGNHMSPYFLFSTGGRLENKLPALFIITPPWFSSTYPVLAKNLLANENRMLIANDIYHTLTGLHKLPEFSGKAFEQPSGLFEVLPNRSCYEAGILFEWWCAFENFAVKLT